MRLLCQTIAIRANREDGETGEFWQSRYVASAGREFAAGRAAYVDLNPIRAALAQTETSPFTSAYERIQAWGGNGTGGGRGGVNCAGDLTAEDGAVHGQQ